MNYKIVSDSSSNVLTIAGAKFESVPMKVRTEREYVDNAQLNLEEMVEDLRNYKGKSGSSCPSVGEWVEAFGDAEMIFCTTISKNLSGSYNSAMQAAAAYMEEHPSRKVYVFDSLAAGPQQAFLIEKMIQLAEEGLLSSGGEQNTKPVTINGKQKRLACIYKSKAEKIYNGTM